MGNVFVAIENLLSDPESECGNAGSDRGRPSRIPALGFLLFPPLQFILPVAHYDDRFLATGGSKGLSGPITVAALIHHAPNVRKRRYDCGDRFLCRRLIPITLNAIHDFEFWMLFDTFRNTGMNRVIDRSAGQATDLQQVASLYPFGQLYNLLLTVILEIDYDPPSARFSDDTIE